jgi:hypothetical protein
MLKAQERTTRLRRGALVLGHVAAVAGLCLGMNATALAQTSLPRMTIDQLQYKGAFRIPSGTYGSSSANYANGPIGYNPDRKSLYVAGAEQDGAIAEFKVPDLVNSTSLGSLNTAGTPLQAFTKVTSKASILTGQGIKISGIHYNAGKLMVNVYRFYDLTVPFLSTPTLILSSASNIAGSTTKGYATLGGGSAAGGWVSPIPAELQSMLGGTHMAGWTSSTLRALVYNTSEGPAAFSFNANTAIANDSLSISTNQLMSFSPDDGMVTRAQLSNTDHTNKLWTFMSEASFAMVVPGTRTYMALGGSGGHESGVSYGDPPYGGYKAYYSNDKNDRYPYYWLFDVNDLDKVRKGTLRASQVRPYAYGKFNVPFAKTGDWTPVAGGSYDETTGTLYLSVYRADTSGGGNTPVIVAYQVGAAVARPKAPTDATAR